MLTSQNCVLTSHEKSKIGRDVVEFECGNGIGNPVWLLTVDVFKITFIYLYKHRLTEVHLENGC